MGSSGAVQPERRTRRIFQAFVRVYLSAARMGDGDELKAVSIQNLLQLVGDANFVAAIPRLELLARDPDVLIRIRYISKSRPFPRTHLAAAHEIGNEFKALAIPGVKERTGRRFAVELGDSH